MANTGLKFVDFAEYCAKCKHKATAERLDPCNECLETPAREGTEEPVKFEKKSKED